MGQEPSYSRGPLEDLEQIFLQPIKKTVESINIDQINRELNAIFNETLTVAKPIAIEVGKNLAKEAILGLI